ncbi:MAG: 30S ribosomal protein S2 [Deltaproteobacteria bacterium]|nr:30S ribosomal protein S2 [Deltaproteobacteria bacterium]
MATNLKELLEAGVHFGHQTKRWNPKMKQYIFGARNGIHIVDLQQTVKLVKNSMNFLSRVTSEGDVVLFVGTKPQAQIVMEEEAQRCRMPYVTNRWLGGSLTNFVTVRKSLDRIDEIDGLLAEGSVERLQKKEVVRLEKEQTRLLKNLRGLRQLKGLPGAMFVIDPNREKIAIREANRLGIPVVAVVDTNCDPDNISYVIPGNDDALRSIRLMASLTADACTEGSHTRKGGADWEAVSQVAPGGEGGPEVVIRGNQAPNGEEEKAAEEPEAAAEGTEATPAPEATETAEPAAPATTEPAATEN